MDLTISTSLASPSELYTVLVDEMTGQGIAVTPSLADGDCTLVTTSYVVNGAKAWGVLVHAEKKAYPVLLNEAQLRELAERATLCADELKTEAAA